MRSISVLVVDDEQIVLDMVQEYLETNTGYSIDTATSAQDALKKIGLFPYDVMVSDYAMPEMNGLELLQQIRTFSQIPFILMTGTDNAKIVIDAINLGVDFYLKKGHDTNLLFTELIHMIERGVQRKRASDTIQENLSNFEKRFELSLIPTIICSPDGTINKINPAAISLFSLSNPALLQEIPFIKRVIGEDAITRVLSGDTFSISSQVNFTQVNKIYPGIFHRTDTIYFEISFVPTIMVDGNISEYVIQIIDNTSEFLAKDELKKTSEQLSMALEGSQLGIWDWNIQTGEVVCNDRWAEIIGYSLEELSPVTIQTWMTSTHQKDLEVSDQLLQKHFSGELPFYECEARMRHKNGRWVWILDRGRVVERDSAGTPVRMIGTHSDITDQKQAEEEVTKSKEKLQLILDSTVEGIYGVDLDNICTFCNAACLKILGFSHAEELIGKHVHEVIYHTKRDGTPLPLHESRLYQALVLGTQAHADDESFWRSDGTSFDVEYWSYPQYKDNTIIGGVVTFIDITERKERDRALFEKNQQVEEFFSVSLELLCIANTDGFFIRLNPAWEQVLGWSISDLTGKRFLDFVHPDDLNATLSAIDDLVRQKRVFNFKNRYRCKDGRYRWLEWRSTPVNNLIYAAAQDITEVIINDDLLRRQRNILFAISYAATLLMSSFDKDSISKIIAELGTTVRASRSYFFTHSYDQNEISRISRQYEWVADGIEPQINNMSLQNLDWNREGYTRWAQILMNHGIIYGNVNDFPENEKPLLEEQSIKSIAVVPVFFRKTFYGFIGFDYCSREHSWFDVELESLEVAAGLLGATLGRQKIEEEILIREANLSTFFNSIDDFLFVLDTDGNIVKVNNTVNRRLEYSDEELIGHSILRVHPEKRRQEAYAIMHKMLDGTIHSCPIPLITRSGMQIPVETRAVLGDWDGHPAIFGVSKDVSAIALSEEKFSKAFHASGSLMAISSLETGEFIDVNNAFLETLGYTREEVIGRTSSELGLFEEPQSRQTIVDEIQKNGRVRIPKMKVKDKHGRTILGIFSADLLQIQNVEVILSVFDDISEIIRLSDTLLQANNKLQLLSSITRHDILNQVQALFFIQELMKQEILPEDKLFIQLEMLEKAVDTIYHQILFTKDYQDLGTHAAGWVLIEPIINTVKGDKLFSSIEIDVNTGDLEIFLDPMFSKVCFNLFENALRHGEHVTHISVYFQTLENNGVLVFEDDGIGVPQADKDKIFKQGFGKNTGFGLFLKKEILSITGIAIRETGIEGKGARFELVIPPHGFRMRSKE